MDAKTNTKSGRRAPNKAVPSKKVGRMLRRADRATKRTEREVKSLAKEDKSKQPRGERKRHGGGSSGLENQFQQAMMYPDLTGPQVMPLQGGGDRVVTGMCRSTIDLYNTSTYPVGIVWMSPAGISAQCGFSGGAATISGPLSANQITQSWDLAFPSSGQVQDYCPTTGCITAEWLGAVLNTGGSVLVGNLNGTVSATAFGALSYTQLRNLPGVVEFELTEVMDQGLIRIPLVHQGPQSWGFSSPPTNSVPPGINWPFIALAGAPLTSANTLRCTLEMFFMSHTADGANTIPYDSGPRAYTKDADAFQNALAKIGSTALDLITLGYPEFAVVRNLLPEWSDVSSLFKSTPKSAYRSIGRARLSRLQKQFPSLQVHHAERGDALVAQFEDASKPDDGKEEVLDQTDHIDLARRISLVLSPSPKRN